MDGYSIIRFTNDDVQPDAESLARAIATQLDLPFEFLCGREVRPVCSANGPINFVETLVNFFPYWRLDTMNREPSTGPRAPSLDLGMVNTAHENPCFPAS